MLALNQGVLCFDSLLTWVGKSQDWTMCTQGWFTGQQWSTRARRYGLMVQPPARHQDMCTIFDSYWQLLDKFSHSNPLVLGSYCLRCPSQVFGWSFISKLLLDAFGSNVKPFNFMVPEKPFFFLAHEKFGPWIENERPYSSNMLASYVTHPDEVRRACRDLGLWTSLGGLMADGGEKSFRKMISFIPWPNLWLRGYPLFKHDWSVFFWIQCLILLLRLLSIDE